MRFTRTTTATVAALSLTALTACGSDSSNSASSATSAASGAAASATSSVSGDASSNSSASGSGEASSSASSSSSAKPIDCPTENTRKFAKTRFATDIGLTAGTFHRYLWKPYKAGTFQKGADGRTKALIKGGATAALDLKLLDNAVKNAQANPTLCKTIAQPLGTAVENVKNMKGDLTSGNFASIMAANTALSQIMSGSQQQGIKIDETTDESKQNEG